MIELQFTFHRVTMWTISRRIDFPAISGSPEIIYRISDHPIDVAREYRQYLSGNPSRVVPRGTSKCGTRWIISAQLQSAVPNTSSRVEILAGKWCLPGRYDRSGRCRYQVAEALRRSWLQRWQPRISDPTDCYATADLPSATERATQGYLIAYHGDPRDL